MTPDFIARYVSQLERLAGLGPESSIDRSAMAALRRSLSTWPSVPGEAIRIVAPFLPEQATGWQETLYFLIGGLFAVHPCLSKDTKGYGISFGAALAEAARQDPAQGAERRLLALLGAKSEDLPSHLRHAMTYLHARGVDVDYRRLMRDLNWWDSPNGETQRRWGMDFWRAAEPEDRPSNENSTEKE
jgi:CRISPR system Cascade subunit CasB